MNNSLLVNLCFTVFHLMLLTPWILAFYFSLRFIFRKWKEKVSPFFKEVEAPLFAKSVFFFAPIIASYYVYFNPDQITEMVFFVSVNYFMFSLYAVLFHHVRKLMTSESLIFKTEKMEAK